MKFLIPLFFIFIFNSCVPKVIVEYPEVSGKVMDAITNEPIPEAFINETVNTDKKGKFLLPMEKKLGIGTVMGGNYWIQRGYSISKKGYYDNYAFCRSLSLSAYCSDVTIYLVPDYIEESKVHKILKEKDETK